MSRKMKRQANVNLSPNASMTSPKQKTKKEEVLEILTHQSEYIDQLEKENRFLKDELSSFKRRLEEVVRENQQLHDRIRSGVINQTINKANLVASQNLQEYIDDQEEYFTEKLATIEGKFDATTPEKRKKDEAFKQWKQEMENMKAIYEAKIEGLESEMKLTKKNYENALNEAQTLKEQVSQMDLLLRKPSTSPQSASKMQSQLLNISPNIHLIEQLTKERDDLMKSVASMRNSFIESQRKESSLRQQIQRGLAMVEDVQLEKAQMKVEKDRMKKDLELTRQRLEDEISSTQHRIADAAMHQRKACQEEMNELLKKVGELTAMLTTCESNLESAGREKATMTIQLDDAKRQLLIANEDLGKMRSEIEFEVRSTVKGYKGAEEELRQTEAKLQQEILKMNQERVRLEQESSEQQRRLSSAQTEGLASNELNVTLTKQLNDALHRLQDIRLAKEKFEKESKEEMELLKSESTERETRLAENLHKSEIEYEQRLSDLENISSKQFNLITRLREEGKTMEVELKKLSKKFRTQVGSLSQEKDMALERLSRILAANKELEEQVVRHGMTHREMQERMRELDERTRKCEGYASTMLEENDRLNLDRSMLEKEIKFLQSQVLPPDTT